MRPYFLFIYLFFLFNIIQHNIIYNKPYNNRAKKKRRSNSKKTNKQTNTQTKSEIRKFNRLTTTGKTNRKIKNSARLLNYYKSTLIRNAQGGPLISVFVKISVCYCNFSFALDLNFQENNENLQFWGLKLVSSQVNVISSN